MIFMIGCFGLMGCSNQHKLDQIDALLKAIPQQNATYHKRFYSYYLEDRLGRRYANELANVFVDGNDTFYMNLDVAKVLNDAYYHQNMANDRSQKPLLEGTFDGYEDQMAYRCDQQPYQDQVYTTCQVGYFHFGSIHHPNRTFAMIYDMLSVAKNVELHRDQILEVYSTKQIKTYQTKPIPLFEDIPAESGSIEELLNQNNSAGNIQSTFPQNGTTKFPDDQSDDQRITE